MPNLLQLSNALALGAILAMAAPALADDESKQRGFDIAERSDASDNGFGDSVVSATMILRNAAGQETTRELTFSTLERESVDVGDKSLVVFRSPRDIEGTALLSHAKILEPDGQWLYLPASNRIRRISSANKSGPFVGSEFAFEDFTSLELNKYSYDHLGEETITVEGEELLVDVVERIPQYENSGYSRQLSYVDREIDQVRRVVFFDEAGNELKILNSSDYREYGEGIWRAHKLAMANTITGKSTDLVYDEFTFDNGFTDRDFVANSLRSAR